MTEPTMPEQQGAPEAAAGPSRNWAKIALWSAAAVVIVAVAVVAVVALSSRDSNTPVARKSDPVASETADDPSDDPSVEPPVTPDAEPTVEPTENAPVKDEAFPNRDDTAFLADLIDWADQLDLDINATGLSPHDYILVGEELCTRAADGEDWGDLAVSVPMAALEDTGNPDDVNLAVLLAGTVSPAYKYICPEQFDTAIEQITGMSWD